MADTEGRPAPSGAASLSVRRRLVVVFAVLAGILLLPAAYAGWRLDELSDLAVEERSRHASATLALGRFQAGLTRLDQSARSFLVLQGDPATLDDGREQLSDARATIRELRQELDRLQAYGFAMSTDSLAQSVDSLAAILQHVEGLVEQGDLEQATEDFVELADPQFARTQELLPRVGERMEDRSQADFARAQTISDEAAAATWLALAVAVLVALGVGFWATYSLSRPLRRLRDALAQVGEGAFDAPPDLPYDRNDEIGDLSRGFRWMTIRLAELDRMKSEFAGVVTHELKNPIHVIRGYADLLREGIVDGEMTDRQRGMLASIQEQTTLLTRLVERLLDISRLEAGAYPIRPQPVAPRELIEAVVHAFAVLARKDDIQLESTIEASTPATVLMDPDVIRNEVLGNLMANALKYTPAGGDVHIRTWGHGTLEEGPAHLALEVSDSGPGVSPDKAESIFEKYYQAGDSDRDLGSGLGLAIARETVEAHRGTIQLVSVEGRGATFRVLLPVGGPDGGSVATRPAEASLRS